LETLEHSIKYNKELMIHYHGRYLSNQILRVQPYKLVFSVDNLYLIAFSPTEDKIRKFRFSNIETVEELPKNFYKNRDIENYITTSQTLFANDTSLNITIHLHVSAKRAKYFDYKKYLHSQKILYKYDTGEIKVEYKVNNFNEIDNLIIKWLPEVKILKPEDFKIHIQKRLTKKLVSLS
ncbi:MAG TPA: WYL domain-containing protein, partial [Arcobacter sp.]|nr:WYL domain-containing protein [Arcobacter sp.]